MPNPTNKYLTSIGLQQPSASDLTDGTTGTGAVVEAGSPTLTGTPAIAAATATTPTTADNSTKVSTTAYVQAQGYVTAATSPVTSVFTRTGAVVATSGDYSVAQVTGAAPLASPALTGTPTAPTAALATNTTQLATTAFVIANSPGSAAGNWITQGRVAVILSDGSSTGFNVTGDLMAIQGAQGGGSPASVPASANNNPAVACFGTGATVATGWQGNLNYRTGRNIRLHCESGPARIVNARYWFGLTDQTFATMSASDNPAGNYAAFRFSTVASDTHYQAITKDNTTQTVVDTGITPVAISAPANIAYFDIIFNDSTPNVLFYINGSLVATIATHLPTTATNLRFQVAQTPNTNTTNMGIYLAQAMIYTDNA